MTANARKLLIAATALFVTGPSLGTVFGFGPMGHHDGTALTVRLMATFLGTSMLALVVGLAGYLYYVNVIAPAPRKARVPLQSS